MRTGKLADLLCPLGWSLLYTVPKGEHGSVSVNLASSDGTAVTVQIAHVKQGNGETISRSAKDTLISPVILTNEVVTILDLGVDSLDDILVSANTADVVAAAVHSEGIERRREVPTQ